VRGTPKVQLQSHCLKVARTPKVEIHEIYRSRT